jgi:hypothetical protein
LSAKALISGKSEADVASRRAGGKTGGQFTSGGALDAAAIERPSQSLDDGKVS